MTPHDHAANDACYRSCPAHTYPEPWLAVRSTITGDAVVVVWERHVAAYQLESTKTTAPLVKPDAKP